MPHPASVSLSRRRGRRVTGSTQTDDSHAPWNDPTPANNQTYSDNRLPRSKAKGQMSKVINTELVPISTFTTNTKTQKIVPYKNFPLIVYVHAHVCGSPGWKPNILSLHNSSTSLSSQAV